MANINLHITIKPELHKQLQALAEEDGRTVQGELVTLAKEGIRQREGSGAGGAGDVVALHAHLAAARHELEAMLERFEAVKKQFEAMNQPGVYINVTTERRRGKQR